MCENPGQKKYKHTNVWQPQDSLNNISTDGTTLTCAYYNGHFAKGKTRQTFTAAGTNIIIIIIIIVIITVFFLACLAYFSIPSSLLFLSPHLLTRQRPNLIHFLHMSSVSLFILPLIYLLLSPRHEDQCLFISEPQQGLCHSPSILSSHHQSHFSSSSSQHRPDLCFPCIFFFCLDRNI